jgi:hypothetical protein
MQVKSLGYQTDLIFPRFDGEIIDRGDYLIILTPTNPDFYWGNFLLFANPPGRGDFDLWKQIFAEEIGWRPRIKHLAFGWDSPEGDLGQIEPFREAGFHLFQDVILTTPSVNRPPKYNSEVVVKPISSDWEWDQALQTLLMWPWPAGEADESDMAGFTAKEMERYRAMTRAGLGHWFGAFLGEQFTAGLGIFVEGTIGRFQRVSTRPDFRRRGICSTLVYQVSCYAFEQMGVETLVMAADEDYFAARIYESVGFMPTERQVGVHYWWE